MKTIVPVVLSGGSGTRLWPLSSDACPKQFLRLVSDHTLLQDTLLRLDGLGGRMLAPIVICNEAHRFLVAEQLRELAIDAASIVLEPEGRNTAPAVAVAALLAKRAAAANQDPVLLVLPADHIVLDDEAFRNGVRAAITASAEGRLVTFGIVPDRAETGYGYIQRGTDHGRWADVARFVEKPDQATAEQYVASRDYLWNSGMFVFSADTYLTELGRYAPAMVEHCEAAVEQAVVDDDFMRLGESFRACPADSIDYAVMEKTDRASVVALDAGWSDVGSWEALHDVLAKDGDGNTLVGDVLAEACRGSHIRAGTRLVAAVGVENLVIVETEEAVLVLPRDQSQRVKRVLEALKRRRR